MITHYSDRKEQYYSCLSCGTIFLHPLPSVESNIAFEGHNAVEKRVKVEEQRISYFERRLKWLEGGVPETEDLKLFEIGCGAGRFLSLAQKRGWKVEGIELSATLVEQSRKFNPEANIHHGDFIQMNDFLEKYYDAVVALDVIEHIIAPAVFIQRIHQILRPGGILLLQTPNAVSLRSILHKEHWNMLIPEYHFHLFSTRGITKILKSNGFEIILLRTTSGTGTEQGFAKITASIKEILLSSLKLGNALVVLAKSRG